MLGTIMLFFALFLSIKPTHLSLTLYAPAAESGAVITTAHTSPVSNTAQLSSMTPQLTRSELYQDVAARSLGEGAFALAEIACTIKNRLRVSGAPLAVVLRAYHARDVLPNPAHIETVRQIFEGERACPATWWYALSLQDTQHWRPHPEPALVITRDHRVQVWIFHH